MRMAWGGMIGPMARDTLGGILCSGFPGSYLACAIIGAIASASRFLTIVAVEWVIGTAGSVILQHAAIS